MNTPLTVTAVAALLGVSRQTASKAVNHLGLGTRLGESPTAAVILSASDLPAIRAHLEKNQQKKEASKFQSDNDLWTRREKVRKKRQKKRNR